MGGGRCELQSGTCRYIFRRLDYLRGAQVLCLFMGGIQG